MEAVRAYLVPWPGRGRRSLTGKSGLGLDTIREGAVVSWGAITAAASRGGLADAFRAGCPEARHFSQFHRSVRFPNPAPLARDLDGEGLHLLAVW